MRLEVEVVTPLFLGGAEGRGEPELRAASIRGALRFWLRALLGGVMGDKDRDGLRRAEAAVFGSTDTGASPVVVRVINSSRKSSIPFSALAHDPGIAYLFFSARGTKGAPERKAIPAGSSFELELTLRAGVRDKEALTKAYAALWLLTHLGGLGARSRRGAGSLQVSRIIESEQDWKETGLPPLEIRANNPSELQRELKEGLDKWKQFFGGWNPSVAPPSDFDVLHPKACEIWVVDEGFGSWQEALNFIGSRMRGFRHKRPPDYGNVKTALQTGTLKDPVERAAFGLPIVFYYRSLGGKRGTLVGEYHDRRASPLLIRVTRLASGKYALVLTFYRAHLLQVGEKLMLKSSATSTPGSPPTLMLVSSFVSHIGKCLKVM